MEVCRAVVVGMAAEGCDLPLTEYVGANWRATLRLGAAPMGHLAGTEAGRGNQLRGSDAERSPTAGVPWSPPATLTDRSG